MAERRYMASIPEIDLLDGHFYAKGAHLAFAWMRANAPLYWDEKNSLWGVSRHADIMAFSKNPGTFCSRFSSRPDAPPIPSMINLDDPLHKRRRAGSPTTSRRSGVSATISSTRWPRRAAATSCTTSQHPCP
jgi:cytochrome P450